MNYVWPAIFICSCIGLAYFVFKTKWLTTLLRVFIVNAVLGLVVVYVINKTGWINALYVPINYFTITTVGLLGIPGVILLVSLKMLLF